MGGWGWSEILWGAGKCGEGEGEVEGGGRRDVGLGMV